MRAMLNSLFIPAATIGLVSYAADVVTEAEPYVLPPFEVTEVPPGLPWKYVQADDVEMLTLWPRDKSEDVLRAELRGRMLFPKALQGERTMAPAIILFDATITKSPKASLNITRRSEGYARLSPTGGFRGWDGGIRAYDGDAVVIAMRSGGTNLATTHISHGLSEMSLHECRPEQRTWLYEGIFGGGGVYSMVGYYGERDEVRFASLLWINTEETEKLKRNPRAVPELIPLGRFFNDPPPDQTKEPQAYAFWVSQARLFTHWALVARTKPAIDASSFWRFANDSRLGPITDERFKAYFGRDFATAIDELKKYLPQAVKTGADRALPGLHSSLQNRRFNFRDATEAEVARIKGNFERMEANRLRNSAPDLAKRYEEAARKTLSRAMHFMPVDNRLYAILGQLEYDSGHITEARRNLERANESGDLTTWGLLDLAQLRMQEVLATLPADMGMPPHAVEQLLTLLFAARDRKPLLVDTYRLIGEVWSRSAVTPSRDQLAVLDEGLQFFPWDDSIRQQAASLYKRFGYSDAVAVEGRHLASP
jgi:hypothetical protein